jgi:cyclic pyranopterin phosphate synthase
MTLHGGTVDISCKDVVYRQATASSTLVAEPAVIARVRDDDLPKKGVLQTARAAALLAAKRTPGLIPHCHPVCLTSVQVDFAFAESAITVRCTVSSRDRTGPEMEALCGAAIAALTIYDMTKGVCSGASITETRLIEKKGGKSGHWVWRVPGSEGGPG